MKYRIVKTEKGNYQVQAKWLFLWSPIFSENFKDPQDAFMAISQLREPKETVIWESQ